jgi:hypothetical protein
MLGLLNGFESRRTSTTLCCKRSKGASLLRQMSQVVHGLVISDGIPARVSGVRDGVGGPAADPETARLGARLTVLWMTAVILSHVFMLGYGWFFVDALMLMALAVTYLLLTRGHSHWGEFEEVKTKAPLKSTIATLKIRVQRIRHLELGGIVIAMTEVDLQKTQDELPRDVKSVAAAATDEVLVAAAKSGDCQAFLELWTRHTNRVFKTTYRITGNREDAEDAMQDVWMKAHLHLNTFNGRAQFTTWLTSIAINTSLMILRRRRVRPETTMDIGDGDT